MDVKVTATASGTGPIEWEIDGKKPHKSQLEFPPRSGPHKVKFKLHDSTGRDLRFDSADPFWAHIDETGQCPQSGAANPQTGVHSCSDRELTIANKNSGDPCTIHYQLNFVDGQGNAVGVDPIFKNGGGGFG
jgi:hypothetical protein